MKFFIALICFLGTFIYTSAQLDTSAFQFLVNFEENTTQDSILKYLNDLNSTEIWQLDDPDIALWEVNGFPFTTPDGEEINNILGVIRASRQKTKISGADFNILTSIEEPNFTMSSSCFNLGDYNLAPGSYNVKVSIFDTGILDISDNSTSSYNYNLTSYSGYDYVNDDSVPEDENGHGTHIAGIIHSIAKQNPAANISFDIRKTHNANGRAYISDLILALDDAIDEDVDIINMSFGNQFKFDPTEISPFQLMLKETEEEDILIITSAGNNNGNNDDYENTILPATYPESNIISVAALKCDETPSSYSNYGSNTVHISVLGDDIPGPDLGTGILNASGTSQAAAIMTANAAILGTYMFDFEPETIKCNLLKKTTYLPALLGKTITEGKVNLSASYPFLSSLENYTVTSTLDSGTGTLRHAIENTCDVETINFSSSLNGQDIVVNSEKLTIDNFIVINGRGPLNTILKFNNGSNLKITHAANIEMNNLTLSVGSSPSLITLKGNLKARNIKLE